MVISKFNSGILLRWNVSNETIGKLKKNTSVLVDIIIKWGLVYT